MFNLRPERRDTRQTAGRNLSDLLRLQGQAGDDLVGEVDKYGQRVRGADITEQIEAMTPEQKKVADFLSMGGKGIQSKQTLDMLKGLAGQQEADKLLDFRKAEGSRNRTHQSALKKLTEGKELNQTETKGLIDGLKTVDKDIMLLRGQLAKATDDKTKAGVWAKIQDRQRQKGNMERLLNPDLAKGIETESFKRDTPSGYFMEKLIPVAPEYKKKETNIFGF